MKRYLHGWSVFFETLHMQQVKAHGSGRKPWRQAIFFSRCARWIAAQQHLPTSNPYWKTTFHQRVPHMKEAVVEGGEEE